VATVDLSQQDIDYIGRVVATEVPSGLRRTNPREYARMVGAVVDTMANRLAARKYGPSIEAVANQRRAFSKITGPRSLNPYGSVSKAPKAPKDVQATVNAHIAKRAQGVPSEVAGALDYANPHFSDLSNLRSWVNPMISAGALKLGQGLMTHFHGLAPGKQPAPDVGYRTPAGFMPEMEPGMARQIGIPTPSPKPSVPEVERQREQRAMMAGAGVLGLDGRQSGTFSAPAGTITRGPALQAALDRMSGTPTANGYAQMERSMRQTGALGLDGRQAPMGAPVTPVERRALPAVGASSFPARPGVIAPNNTRTATPALDRALEQRGISRPSAPAPATQQTATRDPSTLSPGTYPGRVVGDGIAPTFAGQQQPALTSPTSLSSFPARPATIAPNTRPALAAAMQKAGLVTPGDPAPTRLSPSLDSQQLSPVSGVPVTTVRTRPVEIRAIPQQPKPTTIAPVKPRQIAPVQPRVVQPVQQPPQPIQPVQAPAPLGQQAFNARANPATPGLRAADVYGGQIGTAQTSTPGTTVSRETSFGPTTVTNAWGAKTAMVGDRQAAVGKPFGGLGGNLSPNAKSVLGGLAGGILGAMAAGPTGALAGGMLGRKMASGGLSGSSAPGGGGGQAGGGLLGGMFGGGTVGNARGGNNERSGGTGGGTIGGGGGRGRRGGQGN